MKWFSKKSTKLLILLLSLDILILLLHLIFPEKSFFNLDMESNLPTIYQGSKLILIACVSLVLLFLEYIKVEDMRKNWFWIFWSVMFFFLGVDEIGQIHENVSQYMKEIFKNEATSYEAALLDVGYSSTTWLPYYIFPFILATIIVAIALKKLYRENNKTVWFLIIGWSIFLAVPVIEYLNTMSGIMFQEGYQALVFIEESLEMFGASFLLSFTLIYLFDSELLRKTV